MKNVIPHIYTSMVVCPYCGYNSWIAAMTKDPRQYCPKCEKEFFLNVHTTIEYSTYKLDENENPIYEDKQ